jgi:hypothetical protein
MTMRTTEKTITFHRPFCLKGVDRLLPAVMTDEELIGRFRLIAGYYPIFVPAPSDPQ